jgi:hypothetical protein
VINEKRYDQEITDPLQVIQGFGRERRICLQPFIKSKCQYQVKDLDQQINDPGQESPVKRGRLKFYINIEIGTDLHDAHGGKCRGKEGIRSKQ